MCRAASGVLTGGYIVKWLTNSDSHEDIIEQRELVEGGTVGPPYIVRFEVTPPDGDLSVPLEWWKYKVDQDKLPNWYDDEKGKAAAMRWLSEWAAVKLNGWKVKEAFNPFNPLLVEDRCLPEDELRRLVAEWVKAQNSISYLRGSAAWSSVSATIVDCFGESILEEVRSSVWWKVWHGVEVKVINKTPCGSSSSTAAMSFGAAFNVYVASLFPGLQWAGTEAIGPDPWRPMLTLLDAGYIPVFDGATWRLHKGRKADVVMELTL